MNNKKMMGLLASLCIFSMFGSVSVQSVQPNVTFLEKYTEGDLCVYSMLFDGDRIYTHLVQKGTVTTKELPEQVCPSRKELKHTYVKKMRKKSQPSRKEIVRLIKDFELFLIDKHREKNYVIIDDVAKFSQMSLPAGQLVNEIDKAMGDSLLTEAVKELKTLPVSTQVFLINKPGLWFVVVAYKKNNILTFYVSDRSQKEIQDYHKEAVQLLTKLVNS